MNNFEENLPDTSLEIRRKIPMWIWLLLVSLLLGGGFVLWRWLSFGNKASSAANAPPLVIPVKIATLQLGKLEDSSEYIASTESRQSVKLQPRIQGQVARIFVRPGTFLQAGNPIIQIDSRQQQAAVSSYSAAVESAKSQLENVRSTLKSLVADRISNEADLKLNQQDYKRYSSLADFGAVSRQTRDQYTNKLATAQAKIRSIDAQIRAQQAKIAQAQKNIQQAQANTKEQQVQLQYYTINAPFAGTVGEIPVKVGDFVSTSTQLTTLTNNKRLEINIFVPVEKGPQLRKGMPVEIIDAQGYCLGISRVFFVAPAVNNSTQSILIKSLFDNSKDQLKADQFVNTRVIWNQLLGILIPSTSVNRVAGDNFVYVTQMQRKPQGKAQLVVRQRHVKLGEMRGNNYQVLEGLQPGEKIVVSGLLNLKDGVPVMPEP
jgi:RND family efflux transporter MFP subunit